MRGHSTPERHAASPEKPKRSKRAQQCGQRLGTVCKLQRGSVAGGGISQHSTASDAGFITTTGRVLPQEVLSALHRRVPAAETAALQPCARPPRRSQQPPYLPSSSEKLIPSLILPPTTESSRAPVICPPAWLQRCRRGTRSLEQGRSLGFSRAPTPGLEPW